MPGIPALWWVQQAARVLYVGSLFFLPKPSSLCPKETGNPNRSAEQVRAVMPGRTLNFIQKMECSTKILPNFLRDCHWCTLPRTVTYFTSLVLPCPSGKNTWFHPELQHNLMIVPKISAHLRRKSAIYISALYMLRYSLVCSVAPRKNFSSLTTGLVCSIVPKNFF